MNMVQGAQTFWAHLGCHSLEPGNIQLYFGKLCSAHLTSFRHSVTRRYGDVTV